MARTPSKTTTPAPEPMVNEAALMRLDNSAQELVQLQDAVAENARAMARQLGYEGSLTVGALEDQIRFQQRRTVEACMALGASLLLLKELTPHGEFMQRVDLLGVSDRMARKFMSAALKFSNRNSSAVLVAAGNQTKLLELIALDDDELDVLATGGSARGITIEKLDTMTVSELKEALRQSEQDAKFSAEKREKAERRADTAEKKLAGNRPVVVPLDERIEPFQVEIAQRQSLIERGLSAHHEATLALEAWWTQEVTQAPDYDPEAIVPLPRSVALVALSLQDSLNRLAEMVGAAQHAFDDRFGADIAEARQYLMAMPEATDVTAA